MHTDKSDESRRHPASWPRFLKGQRREARQRAQRRCPSKNANGLAIRPAKRASQGALSVRIKIPLLSSVCIRVHLWFKNLLSVVRHGLLQLSLSGNRLSI